MSLGARCGTSDITGYQSSTLDELDSVEPESESESEQMSTFHASLAGSQMFGFAPSALSIIGHWPWDKVQVGRSLPGHPYNCDFPCLPCVDFPSSKYFRFSLICSTFKRCVKILRNGKRSGVERCICCRQKFMLFSLLGEDCPVARCPVLRGSPHVFGDSGRSS